jgi:hypothetical protein
MGDLSSGNQVTPTFIPRRGGRMCLVPLVFSPPLVGGVRGGGEEAFSENHAYPDGNSSLRHRQRSATCQRRSGTRAWTGKRFLIVPRRG